MKVRLGEKEYDLAKSLPITLGDLRRFKKEYGMDLATLSAMDLDNVAKVLHLLLRKIDPDISEETIDLFPLPQLGAVAKFLTEATGEAVVEPDDRPT